MKHMCLNSNSLINKIYGLFSANFNQISTIGSNSKNKSILHFAL